MIITCDASCNMGYIYVRPPCLFYNMDCISNISQFYKDIVPIIPFEKNESISLLLDQLTISSKTYLKAIEDGDIDQEYKNDMDENGYITGIELDLSESEFIKNIETNSYRIYDTIWRNERFRLITFESMDAVRHDKNMIYPLTKDHDSFVVIKVKSKYNIGLIVALVTCREDIYPIEYLKKPQFLLNGI